MTGTTRHVVIEYQGRCDANAVAIERSIQVVPPDAEGLAGALQQGIEQREPQFITGCRGQEPLKAQLQDVGDELMPQVVIVKLASALFSRARVAVSAWGVPASARRLLWRRLSEAASVADAKATVERPRVHQSQLAVARVPLPYLHPRTGQVRRLFKGRFGGYAFFRWRGVFGKVYPRGVEPLWPGFPRGPWVFSHDKAKLRDDKTTVEFRPAEEIASTNGAGSLNPGR